MTPEMIERLRRIYNHFGTETQNNKLAEESKEYIKAHKFGTEFEKIDEKADLFIQSAQHYLCYPGVKERVMFKLDRTEKRIKENYYE